MKKRFVLLIALLFLNAAGCAEPFEGRIPAADSVTPDTSLPTAQVEQLPDTVFISADTFSAVKAIEIHSGITGKKQIFTDPAVITEILAAVDGLEGHSPISSRGYYGWSYGFSLYDTENPGEDAVPLDYFGLMINKTPEGVQGLIYHGTYEIWNGNIYRGLYSADAEKIQMIDEFCHELFAQ